MDIKGEANIFKVDVAKNLKQFSENAEVVIGKKTENNTTEIKIEDKSKHLSVNINLIVVGSVPPEQIDDITKRIKEILDTQAEIIRISGDDAFLPYLSEEIGTVPVAMGTANTLLINNADYILKGKSEPTFVKLPLSLPLSINVFQPKIITD